MTLTRGGFWTRFIGGIVLFVRALVAVLWPFSAAVIASGTPSYEIGAAPRDLVLEADTTYGIYVVDRDNSGFSIACSVFDEAGRRWNSRTGRSPSAPRRTSS